MSVGFKPAANRGMRETRDVKAVAGRSCCCSRVEWTWSGRPISKPVNRDGDHPLAHPPGSLTRRSRLAWYRASEPVIVPGETLGRATFKIRRSPAGPAQARANVTTLPPAQAEAGSSALASEAWRASIVGSLSLEAEHRQQDTLRVSISKLSAVSSLLVTAAVSLD